MVLPSAGDIVILPFPFSDLSNSKIRPAVVLARANRDDWILRQITSNRYGDGQAVVIERADFKSGFLRLQSYARPAKLFTANEKLFVAIEGRLKSEKVTEIRKALIDILNQ